jgi:hypothetical protein
MTTWIYTDIELPTHGGEVLVSYTLGKDDAFVTTARYEGGRWDWGTPAANRYRRNEDIYAWAHKPSAARRVG